MVDQKIRLLVTSIFFFSHNVFKSFLLSGSLEVRIVWYRVNSLPHNPIINLLRYASFKKIVEKCWLPVFLHLPHFQPYQTNPVN